MVKDIALTCGLVIAVHIYILLSALVYNALEGYDDIKPTHYYSEKYLTAALKSWSPQLKDPQSAEFKKFLSEYKNAVKDDDDMENKRAFQSIAKAYLFALTSIATVGNSGMTVTTVGGKSFYLASIVTGIVLYVSMLHRISLPLLQTMRYAADNILCCIDKFGNHWTNPYPKLTVMIMCNILIVISILIFAVGGVFSGHTYLYGLFTTYDSVLTVGNEKWLPLIANWSETVFVLSLSLFLLFELSLVYTTIFASLDAATDDECRRLIARLWEKPDGGSYQPLDQEDVSGPDETYEMIGDKGKKGDTFPKIFAQVEKKKKFPQARETSPRYDHSPSSPREQRIYQPSPLALQSYPVYDEPESGPSKDSPVAEKEAEAPQNVSTPVISMPLQPELVTSTPVRETPQLTIQEESPPLVKSAIVPVSTSGPLPDDTSGHALNPSEPPPAESGADVDLEAGYYEPYEPQRDGQPNEQTDGQPIVQSDEQANVPADTLVIPSRRSSSGSSEYSNISVSDYEKSLDAELERSREFLESEKK